jgi:hypothetical protein
MQGGWRERTIQGNISHRKISNRPSAIDESVAITTAENSISTGSETAGSGSIRCQGQESFQELQFE